MRIGNVEVTLREAIFSVTIASVLFLVGFLISTRIEHCVNQANMQYRQAAQIPGDDRESFALAMRTNVGNAFVDGRFEAVDSVSHGNLDGRWLKILADHQKYTMHTRIVHYTTTDSKGRVINHTRTETYWTWDTYRTENLHSEKVRYVGSEFPYGKFDYGLVGRKFERVKDGHNRRIEFTCIPTNFSAAAYTKLSEGTISDGTLLRQDMVVSELYDELTSSHSVALFWGLWGIVIASAVVAFVVAENDWIED